MSRVGKAPITLPSGVKCELNGKHVKVTGPKGTLEMDVRPEIDVELKDDTLYIKRSSDKPNHRAFHGMTRALLNNLVQGVNKEYEKVLSIVGVGYRGQLSGKSLTLSVGYSHPVVVEPPQGVTFAMEGANTIKITGIDKQLVGQTAAKIRALRKPEPYKAKGIRYVDERIRRKVGKAAGK